MQEEKKKKQFFIHWIYFPSYSVYLHNTKVKYKNQAILIIRFEKSKTPAPTQSDLRRWGEKKVYDSSDSTLKQ